MAAGLRGRQLHGGYTLSVLLACNRAGGTVGIREGRGEAWSAGRHGADVQRRAASGGSEGLPDGREHTLGLAPDLAGREVEHDDAVGTAAATIARTSPEAVRFSAASATARGAGAKRMPPTVQGRAGRRVVPHSRAKPVLCTLRRAGTSTSTGSGAG